MMTQNTSIACMALTTADWFQYNELDSNFKKAGAIIAAKSAALGCLAIAAIETAVSTIFQMAGLLIYPISPYSYSVIAKHTKDSITTIGAAFQKIVQSQKREIVDPIKKPLQNSWSKLKNGVHEIGAQLKIGSDVARGVFEKHRGKVLGVALVTTLVGLSFFFQVGETGEAETLLKSTCAMFSSNSTEFFSKGMSRVLNNTYEAPPIHASTEYFSEKTSEALGAMQLLNNTCEAPPLKATPKVFEAIKANIPPFEEEVLELPKLATELYNQPVHEVWGKLADQVRRG